MLASIADGADIEARLTTVAELDAVMRVRGDARRQLEAEKIAKRRTRMRAASEAQATHQIAMPRIALLIKAGALFGSAAGLADALAIDPRSLRKKTSAERGVSNEDLLSAAAALDERASALTQHAQKLRDEAAQ